MRRLFVSTVALLLAASGAVAAPIIQDSFSYTPGSSLVGQVAPTGQTWTSVATTTADDLVINSTTLTPTSYTLPASYGTTGGGSVTYGGKGQAYLLPTGGFSTGQTAYFSMLLDITDLGSSGNTGIIAGLSNPNGVNLPTGIFSLYARPGSTSGTFDLGIARDSAPANAGFSNDIAFGTTIFIVAANQIVSGTSNDVASLWIDPDTSTLGTSSPPTPDVTGINTGSDSTLTNANFLLYQRGSNSAQSAENGISVDEVLVAKSWADATQIPEPATIGLFGLAGVGLMKGRRRK